MMFNQSILIDAIEKAVKNGWNQNVLYLHGNVKNKNAAFLHWFGNQELIYNHLQYDHDELFCALELIYNHGFAKALWGQWKEDINCKVCGVPHQLYDDGQFRLEIDDPWKFHLQQMAISIDPIEYLGKNI